MTVAELIELLKEQPKDARVQLVSDEEGYHYDVEDMTVAELIELLEQPGISGNAKVQLVSDEEGYHYDVEDVELMPDGTVEIY
jgi:hypothetical protein